MWRNWRLVPEDKYLLLPDTVTSTTRVSDGQLPSAAQVIDAVARYADGTDFVGLYAGGPVVRAFADSRGQRNWHSIASFHLEWSVYRGGDQAVKSSYAGAAWDETEFARKMAARPRTGRAARASAPNAVARRVPRVLHAGGRGRVASTLSWGGFGLKSLKTGVCTLMQLHKGEAQLDASVSLTESVEWRDRTLLPGRRIRQTGVRKAGRRGSGCGHARLAAQREGIRCHGDGRERLGVARIARDGAGVPRGRRRA